MTRVLLDTDTLINFLRALPGTVEKAEQHLVEYGVLTVCAITYYETVRGLSVRKAASQQRRLAYVQPQLEVLPIDQPVADQTATIYLMLQAQNTLLPDADLFIASTAIVHDLPLATKNRRHFDRIPQLRLESW